MRTAVSRLVVPTGRRKATGTVAEHAANVPSASRARKSPRKRRPSYQRDRTNGYRQTTRLRLKGHQWREGETEESDCNQDRVRPEHAAPEPLSNRLNHAFSRPWVRCHQSTKSPDQRLLGQCLKQVHCLQYGCRPHPYLSEPAVEQLFDLSAAIQLCYCPVGDQSKVGVVASHD
jgi:hypothetical protein